MPKLSEKTKKELEESRKEIEIGKYFTLKQIKKRLDL